MPQREQMKPGSYLNLASNPKEIAVARDAGAVYVGHRDWVTAGVYKTTDGGVQWSAAVRRGQEDSNIDFG